MDAKTAPQGVTIARDFTSMFLKACSNTAFLSPGQYVKRPASVGMIQTINW